MHAAARRGSLPQELDCRCRCSAGAPKSPAAWCSSGCSGASGSASLELKNLSEVSGYPLLYPGPIPQGPSPLFDVILSFKTLPRKLCFFEVPRENPWRCQGLARTPLRSCYVLSAERNPELKQLYNLHSPAPRTFLESCSPSPGPGTVRKDAQGSLP